MIAPTLLAALPPVGLDELDERARLLERVDRKYLLEADQAGEILAGLEDARVLEIEGAREFAYSSSYFDTPRLDSFRLAALGRPKRWKVRTRRYLDHGGAYLEVKLREPSGRTRKIRVPRAVDAAPDALDAPERETIGAVLAEHRIEGSVAAELQPVLESRYRRSTLLLADEVRATLDVDLAWRRRDGARLARPGLVVVETKTTGATGPLDRMLWRCGARPAPFSKYASALAALDPELPHARWRRPIDAHLADAIRVPSEPVRRESGEPRESRERHEPCKHREPHESASPRPESAGHDTRSTR